MSKREYDPLECLPTVDVVRQRLSKAEAIAAKYRVLLETLERIQAAEQAESESDPRGGQQ